MPEFDNINIKPLKFKKKYFSSYKLIHSNMNMKQSNNNNNNLKYNNEINIKAIGIIGEIHNVNIIMIIYIFLIINNYVGLQNMIYILNQI
jgi:hypothetical protein